MMNWLRATALFTLLAISNSAYAAASPAETRMARYVATDRPYGEALLERLVNQNSGTLNNEGVRIVGQMMRAELEGLGFTVEWIDGTPFNRAGHIIATHVGNGRGKRVLMIGHLDTVFEADSPFQRYSAAGNIATGPGVGDDKGGLVVIIGILRAMRDAGTLANADIKVVLTGDEERMGSPVSLSRGDLVAAAQWADVALEYENLVRDATHDYGTIARRSSSNWQINIHSETGHSSGIFSDGVGYGAIYEMARILDSFRRELREPNLTYNVSLVAGGTPAQFDTTLERADGRGKTNIIPADAVARGDLRSLTVEQDARVRARMTEIVAAHLPGTSGEIVFDDGYPPMSPTAGNQALLDQLNLVNRDMRLAEMPALPPIRRGAADSGFAAPYVDTLGGLGPSADGSHAVGETLELDTIPLMALRSAVLITRLSRQPRLVR